MKNLLIVFFLLLSITAFSQFRMVGTATWSTLNDSTYQGNVSFQSDLTGMGYLATHIVDTFRLFTPVEKIYRIDSVWNKTFSSATLRIVEMLGTQGVPVGQVMVFNPDGRNTIPQNPFGSTGATAQLNAAVDTWNARQISTSNIVNNGKCLERQHTQVGHTFSIGDAVFWDADTLKLATVNSLLPAQAVVTGFVPDSDILIIAYTGECETTLTHGFTQDSAYYVSRTGGQPVIEGSKSDTSQYLFRALNDSTIVVAIGNMYLEGLPGDNVATSTYKYCSTGTSCLSDSTYTQIYSTVDTVLLGTPTYNGELRCFDNQTVGSVVLKPENAATTEIAGDAVYSLPSGQSICFYASPNGPAAWNWYIVSEGNVPATDDNGIISALPNNDVTIQAADHDLRLINIDTLDVQGVNHIKGINSIVIGANGKFDDTGSNGSALLIQPIDAASLVVDNSYPNFWNSSWQDYMVIYKNGSTTYNPTSLPNAYDRRFVRYERYMFHDSTAYRTGLQMRGTLWTNSPNLQAVRLAWYGRQSGATPFVAFNGSSRQVEFPYLSTTTDYYSTNPPGNVTYIGTDNALVNTKPDSILITNPITNSGLITLRSALRTMSLEASSGDNLGNHTATTNIAMAQFDINNANKITSDTVATTNITNLSKAESPTGGTAKSRIIMGTALSIPTSIRTENSSNANQYGQLAVDADGITSLIQVNGSKEAGLKIEADSIVTLYNSGNNSLGFVGDTAKVITNNITAIKVGPTGKVEIKDYLLAETTASPAQAEKFAILPVDCSGGAKTVTPPASPVAGDWFAVSDSRASAGANNITVDTSGDKLHGGANDYIMNANADYVRFTYVNATIGWIKSN